jgi:hypothetical protein
MIPSRREAPARRAPLHRPAAVTFAHQRRCFLLEEKHQLDEYHCMHQQQSPSPTSADASSPRKSTSSTSTTARTSSSHHRQPAPVPPPRGKAPARRAPLHSPAAVTFANQRRCFFPEENRQLNEHHCIHTSSSNLRQPTPMLPTRGGAPARRAPLPAPAAVTFAN